MPLDKLVLIIACVIVAAMATVYLGTALVSATQMSPATGLAVLGLVALCLSVVWRAIAERLNSKDDDHYDRFEN